MTSYNACYKKIREGSQKRLRGRGRAGSAEIQKSIVAFFIMGVHAMNRVGYSGLLVSFVLGLSMSEVGCVLILVKSQHYCFSVPVWLQLRHYKCVLRVFQYTYIPHQPIVLLASEILSIYSLHPRPTCDVEQYLCLFHIPNVSFFIRNLPNIVEHGRLHNEHM